MAWYTRGADRMARLRNPDVETAMPSAMNVAPPDPTTTRITSEAGAVLAASPGMPSTRTYTMFAST